MDCLNKKMVDEIYDSFKTFNKEKELLLDRSEVIEFYRNIKEALFLNYYTNTFTKYNLQAKLDESYMNLKKAFNSNFELYKERIDKFYDSLPRIKESLILDVEAIYEGDPASESYAEIILTYPGFIAISAYRIAHEFYLMDMKFFARIITEYAHARTGVDINPGATIGKSFFIDHGTGIVIGETTIIGNNVKIYQGVTLGALSLKKGHALKGNKRHPTILDNVTIYSGASILGGETVIGNNCVIGSNAFIIKSIEDNNIVRAKPYDIEMKETNK